LEIVGYRYPYSFEGTKNRCIYNFEALIDSSRLDRKEKCPKTTNTAKAHTAPCIKTT
jgi:hypothetical protein